MFALVIASLLIIFQVQTFGQELGQCHGQCLDEHLCGIWMEQTESKSGLYNLKDDRLNLTCSFVSLPNTVKVQWKFKQKGQNHWKNADCEHSHKYECNATLLHEHRSRSFCSSELSLESSGVYRCETKFQEEPTYGTETTVEIIGISNTFEVVDKKLEYNEPGFVEIEICSNPTPQIFFVHQNFVLQPGDSNNKNYIVSTLSKSRKKSMSSSGPGNWHSFCYNSRLLIAKVSDDDIGWKATGLVGQDSRTIQLVDHIGNSGIGVEISKLVIFAIIYWAFIY